MARAVEFLFQVFSVRALVVSGRARLQGAALHLSAAVRRAAHTLLVRFLSRRALRQEARPQAARCRVDLTQPVAVDAQERGARVQSHLLVVRRIFRVQLLFADPAEYSQYHHLDLDFRQAC
jgi:hypothetical protein